MLELSVSSVKHLTGHLLEIMFSDGHTSIVDFAPFIFSAGHPYDEPYKNVEKFLSLESLGATAND